MKEKWVKYKEWHRCAGQHNFDSFTYKCSGIFYGQLCFERNYTINGAHVCERWCEQCVKMVEELDRNTDWSDQK